MAIGKAMGICTITLSSHASIRTAIRRTSGRTEAGSALPLRELNLLDHQLIRGRTLSLTFFVLRLELLSSWV